MAGARGQILKANQVAAAAAIVPWEPRASPSEGPPAEVEVVRDQGVVVGITVRCRCGRVHELELVAPAVAGA